MRWILLIVLVVGCGDTFESELFLEGQNDGGTSDSGPIGVDASVSESASDGTAGYPADRGTSDNDSSGLGDSSPIEAGYPGDGDAGNDATTETGLTCDPYQCQVTCASQGKACSECECV